jgi:hypothetical protein
MEELWSCKSYEAFVLSCAVLISRLVMLLGIGDKSCYSLFAGLQGRTQVGELSKLDFLFNLENTLSACSFVENPLCGLSQPN